jgi:hypothetical protein
MRNIVILVNLKVQIIFYIYTSFLLQLILSFELLIHSLNTLSI